MPLATQREPRLYRDCQLQATVMKGYPENARWIKEGVVFATINAAGPSDNLDYDNGSEACPRRDANLTWLREAFDVAKSTNAPGLMIMWQANPWTPTFGPTWRYLADELKAQTLAFGKPVVLVHGDTHDVAPDGTFRLDKGGRPEKPDGVTERMSGAWTDVPNFTRVETYAGGAFSASKPDARPDKWIRVTVDPKSPQVFSFATETAP
jgi:hypothetical protein